MCVTHEILGISTEDLKWIALKKNEVFSWLIIISILKCNEPLKDSISCTDKTKDFKRKAFLHTAFMCGKNEYGEKEKAGTLKEQSSLLASASSRITSEIIPFSFKEKGSL